MSSSTQEVHQIVGYFGKEAKRRNREFRVDPILMYEQLARQRRVRVMLEPCESLLDLGCGNARDLALYAHKVKRVVGVDISLGMLQEGQRDARLRGFNADFVLGDATHLPFRPVVFDSALCSEVIEHIPEWREALKNLHFVLKRGGSLILTTPNKLSMYGVQKPVVEKLASLTVPFDSWKTWPILRGAVTGPFRVEATYGACMLPGHLSHALAVVLQPMLPYVARIEEAICGVFPWKYLMYMMAMRVRKE